MKTFLKRLLSTVILLGIFSLILFGKSPYDKYVFNIAITIFAYFGMAEFGTILLKSGHSFQLRAVSLASAVTVMSYVTDSSWLIPGMIATGVVLYSWVLFLISRNQEKEMQGIFASCAAYFMLTIPFCMIGFFFIRSCAGEGFKWLFLYLLLVTKIGDIAAYVVGSLSAYFMRNRGGNHKMIPSISPGKSYEGAVGGLVFTLLLSYILWPYCGVECCFAPDWAVSLVLGALMFFGCMGGDLAESAFKRTCNIKDSGSILPGIGGVLDLVDSLMVTAPVLFFCYYFITSSTCG